MAIAHRRAAERTQSRDPATWGVDRQSLRLAANAEVETRADGAGRTTRARRLDAFDLFFARGRLTQGALDAVRRLQADVASLHAQGGGVAAYAERVDRSRSEAGLDERRLRAGGRIAEVLALTGQASARLLALLCEAGAALRQGGDWRDLVERETGERLADAQGAVLRAACENLAAAYAILDRRGPVRLS
ncbi:MAG TPA: hypothetical protein VGI30_01020 [Caulobacteraceae bacterium]|jgi:hypothetical protein